MALSCVWACAAAPTAREAISTALHRKAVLDIASSSVTKFKSIWQMPICLPFECLCTTHASPGTIPARSNADAVSRAIRWKTAEPSSIGAPRCFDNFTTSPGFCVTRNLRARSREIGDVLNVMAPS